MNAVELDKNVLKRWSGISSLANPGESERRELGDGRLAERDREKHTLNALVERGSGCSTHRCLHTLSFCAPLLLSLCKQYIVRAHVFLMRILSAWLSEPVGTVAQVDTAHSHAPTPRTRVAQDSRSTLFVSCSKTVTSHGAMSYVTPHLTTPSTCTPSSSTLSSSPALHPLLSEPGPCADLRPNLSGACSSTNRA